MSMREKHLTYLREVDAHGGRSHIDNSSATGGRSHQWNIQEAQVLRPPDLDDPFGLTHYYWEKALQCVRLAGATESSGAREYYRWLAESYERMANDVNAI